jgi:hypothetical protein
MEKKMINIPIYRAKKIDSDEYVEGYLYSNISNNKYYIRELPINGTQELNTEIDKTTLAIHFPDMKDSQKNRIFASLSENGKGGDILKIGGRIETLFISEATIQTYMFIWHDLKNLEKKTIGIQE